MPRYTTTKSEVDQSDGLEDIWDIYSLTFELLLQYLTFNI